MEQVVAYADKTIVKIEGVEVKGLKPEELEKKIYSIFKRPVRVVGVTSESLEMDIYDLPPERIIKDQQGIIKVLSLVPGLTATEISKISKLEKAKAVDINDIIPGSKYACAAERRI